jgi:hypothetical protein
MCVASVHAVAVDRERTSSLQGRVKTSLLYQGATLNDEKAASKVQANMKQYRTRGEARIYGSRFDTAHDMMMMMIMMMIADSSLVEMRGGKVGKLEESVLPGVKSGLSRVQILKNAGPGHDRVRVICEAPGPQAAAPFGFI